MSAENTPAAPVDVPEAKTETPFEQFASRLPEIITKTSYKEMWGVELAGTDHIPTQIVLTKFLRANNGDVDLAEKQLTSALEWRKKIQPASLVDQTKFDKSKFGDLGFVTVHKDEAGKETIITWNIYGAVKDNKATFGNVPEFLQWRAALMELSLQKLNLKDAKEPIPEDGEDQYQMIQVHDYQSVSFFRMDPNVKAASKETIETFSMAYPELLAHKYFVNVPAIMGWMYAAMKLFMAPTTLKKFHPMSSGTTLATELTTIVSTLPKEYGGGGPSVKEGLTVSLEEKKQEESKPDVPETELAKTTEAAAPKEEAVVATQGDAAAPTPAVEAEAKAAAEKADA